MTNLRSIKLSYKPTPKIAMEIDRLTIKLRSSQEYTGVWTVADTVRYLLAKPYIDHSYPTNIRRSGLKSVNVSQEEYNNLSPMLERDMDKLKPSKCAWIYRLIVSGLIQEGVLNVDDIDRQPRKLMEPTPI